MARHLLQSSACVCVYYEGDMRLARRHTDYYRLSRDGDGVAYICGHFNSMGADSTNVTYQPRNELDAN